MKMKCLYFHVNNNVGSRPARLNYNKLSRGLENVQHCPSILWRTVLSTQPLYINLLRLNVAIFLSFMVAYYFVRQPLYLQKVYLDL